MRSFRGKVTGTCCTTAIWVLVMFLGTLGEMYPLEAPVMRARRPEMLLSAIFHKEL